MLGSPLFPEFLLNPPIHDLRNCNPQLTTPVIDLHGLDSDPVRRKEIVEMVREASETWGFFSVVNHGIPESVLEEMMDGTCRFHELDNGVKKEFYTRDTMSNVIYTSNFDLYVDKSADWRDNLYCLMAPQSSPSSPTRIAGHMQVCYTYIHSSSLQDFLLLMSWIKVEFWGLLVFFFLKKRIKKKFRTHLVLILFCFEKYEKYRKH